MRGYFKLTDKAPRPALDPHAFVLTLGSIGVPAYDAGRRIWVIDIGGLAEPLAARTAPVPGRPAGHRKQIDDAWYDARFAAVNAATSSPKDVSARHALTCGPIPGLLDAVDAKLTPGRFLSNIWHSFGYTRLQDPERPGRRRATVVPDEIARPGAEVRVLRVAGERSERGEDRLGHDFHGLRGVDGDEDPALAVVVEDRTHVVVEQLQAVLDDAGIGVVDPAAAGPAREPSARDVVVLFERQVDRGVGVDTARECQLVRAFGLGARPGEAVEDVTARGRGPGERFTDDREHDVVRNEIAAREAAGHLDAEVGLRRNVRPQQLAARDVGHAEALGQALALGAFPGARRTEEDDSHGA